MYQPFALKLLKHLDMKTSENFVRSNDKYFVSNFRHTRKYLETYLPWAIRNGQNAKFLMAVYWEEHWEDDLETLRQELNIEPPPIIASKS